MGNETRWYTTREAVKRAMPITGAEWDSLIDSYIAGASAEIEDGTNTTFIPITETLSLRWPQEGGKAWVLMLPKRVLAVTTLTKDDDTATAIAAADYFLEPQFYGPPYHKIEIDKASTAFFSFKNTTQRAVRVTGRTGDNEDTRTAGTVTSGLASDATATSMVCSNESLIGVGNTLLIQSEAIFVSGKTAAQIGTQLLDMAGGLAENKATVTVTVDSGASFNVGEVIQVDSERMLITAISGNNLTVIRAWDGTTLASHADDTAVFGFRTLTIVRGVNGTTAATHANSTAISKYAPPDDIANLCKDMVIAEHVNTRGGWTGQIGSGDTAVESRGYNLAARKAKIFAAHRWHVLGSV